MKDKSSERVSSVVFQSDGKIDFQEHYVKAVEEESLIGKLFLEAYSNDVDDEYVGVEDFGAKQEDADIRITKSNAESKEFQVTRTLDEQEHQKILRDQIWKKIFNCSNICGSPVSGLFSIIEKESNDPVQLREKDIEVTANWFIANINPIIERIENDLKRLGISTSAPIAQRHQLVCNDKEAGRINKYNYRNNSRLEHLDKKPIKLYKNSVLGFYY